MAALWPHSFMPKPDFNYGYQRKLASKKNTFIATNSRRNNRETKTTTVHDFQFVLSNAEFYQWEIWWKEEAKHGTEEITSMPFPQPFDLFKLANGYFLGPYNARRSEYNTVTITFKAKPRDPLPNTNGDPCRKFTPIANSYIHKITPGGTDDIGSWGLSWTRTNVGLISTVEGPGGCFPGNASEFDNPTATGVETAVAYNTSSFFPGGLQSINSLRDLCAACWCNPFDGGGDTDAASENGNLVNFANVGTGSEEGIFFLNVYRTSNSNVRINCGLNNSPILYTANIPVGTWFYVTCTVIQGQGTSLYIDGNLVASNSNQGSGAVSVDAARIGAVNNFSNRPRVFYKRDRYYGECHRLQAWVNTTITQQQIQDYLNGNTTPVNPDFLLTDGDLLEVLTDGDNQNILVGS